MKQYKLMELMFGITKGEEGVEIANIMSINSDMKDDIGERIDELEELTKPIFAFFEDIIRNSKE